MIRQKGRDKMKNIRRERRNEIKKNIKMDEKNEKRMKWEEQKDVTRRKRRDKFTYLHIYMYLLCFLSVCFFINHFLLLFFLPLEYIQLRYWLFILTVTVTIWTVCTCVQYSIPLFNSGLLKNISQNRQWAPLWCNIPIISDSRVVCQTAAAA